MERELPPLTCPEHPKLMLSYYCKGHDRICCEICRSENHRQCSDIQQVKDVAVAVADGELLTQLLARMCKAKESLSETTDKLEDNICTLSRQYDNIKQNIQNARDRINQYLNKMESDLNIAVLDRCIKATEEKIVEFERRKYTLDQWEDDLHVAVCCDDESLLFSMIKIMNELQTEMESYLDVGLQDLKLSRVRWKPIKSDQKSLERYLGHISVSWTSTEIRPSSHKSGRMTAYSDITLHHDAMSVGDVDIQNQSRAEQGLDGIISRTEQGWNDVSSTITKDAHLDITKFGEGLSESKEKLAGKLNDKEIIVSESDEKTQDNNDQKTNDTEKATEILVNNENLDSTERKKNISLETRGGQRFNINASNSDLNSVALEKEDNLDVDILGKGLKLKFDAKLLDKKTTAEVKTGMFLTKSSFLFLDKANKHIFICNKDGKVHNKINLLYKPEDIAIIDDERAVVTLGEHGIQIINVQNMKKDQAHDVGGFCGCITAYKGQIIVSVDQKLRLLDAFGYTLQRITHDGNASVVCTDKNGRIYYTDSMNHTVHCLAWYGIPVFTYSHKSLKCPIGIVVDSDFFIYVAGFETCNIQKLYPDGRFHSEFLNEKDGLYEPSGLSYSEVCHTLLVISDNHQTIESYILKDNDRFQQ